MTCQDELDIDFNLSGIHKRHAYGNSLCRINIVIAYQRKYFFPEYLPRDLIFKGSKNMQSHNYLKNAPPVVLRLTHHEKYKLTTSQVFLILEAYYLPLKAVYL